MTVPAGSDVDAATRSRAAYRLLHDADELRGAQRVLQAVWGATAQALPSFELLRALSHAGNPVLGAVVDDEVVGACIGFLAPAGGMHLHSHITGVLPSDQHAGIGFGLKVAQRDWCLEHGIDAVRWTFDPMLARNAHLNIRKLGATSRHLLPDFYGPMSDELNAGDASDRLDVHWAVRSPRVEAALAGRPLGADSSDVRSVAVPDDYLALRRDDPDTAADARRTVRDELSAALADGFEVVDFARGDGYVLARR